MNDAPDAEESGKAEEDQRTIFDQEPGVDWLLASQIELATNFRLEQGITLFVGGVLVCGQLVSAKRYFEEAAKRMRGASVTAPGPAEDGRIISDTLAEVQERWGEMFPGPLAEGEEREPLQVSYVHLINARVFLPGQKPLPDDQGLLWRGKLTAIDGWSLGTLSPS